MKKILEKLSVFKVGLSLFSFFEVRGFFGLVKKLTKTSARLNLKLNKPKQAKSVKELSETWIDLMSSNGRDLFKINSVKEDTAYVEIHLHCPLRGTEKVDACYQLINYDREPMKNVGGNLVPWNHNPIQENLIAN